MNIFVDTNILLDVVQHRTGFYRYSSQVWTMAERGAVNAFVSMISFNNVFYILRRQVSVTTALDAVRQIRGLFTAVAFDDALLDQAIQMTSKDLEDAIQAASAVRAHADILVTRNVPDFAAMGVKAMTPDEFLAVVKP